MAWLSIDRSETEAVHVWRSLLDAMQLTEEPELRSLTARLPIGERRFLAEFANALSALTHPCVLILDDFQELRAPGVSEQLDSLLRHAPEKLRLVIVSQSRPTAVTASPTPGGKADRDPERGSGVHDVGSRGHL